MEESAKERFWVGACHACHTGVFVDDDFVRRDGHILHRECDLYEEGVIDRELLEEADSEADRGAGTG